jgi:hypothetical protein
MPRSLLLLSMLVVLCPDGVCAQEAGSQPAATSEVPSTSTSTSSSMTPKELAEWLDGEVEKAWGEKELERRPVVDDATFLRRTSLDLTGSIPSVSATRDFLAEKSDDKREHYVEEVLGYSRRKERWTEKNADHFARVWRRVLVPGNGPGAAMATRMDPWLKTQFATNVRYDVLAKSLIVPKVEPPVDGANPATTPLGFQFPTGPAVLYDAIGPTPENLANEFARVFLGVRIGCAQCHDHPFASWKQDDFWGMAAFFSGLRRGQNGEWTDEKIAKIKAVNGSREYSARFLWGTEAATIPADQSPREAFANWVVSRDNPNFSATAVNRVWQYLCGRGMTGAVDDLDTASPEERRILDELAKKFAAHDFDLKWLIAGISMSRTYQRASVAEEDPSRVPPAGARPPKSLLPEQIFASLEQALALPVARVDNGPRHNGEMAQLITRMNEAVANSPEEYRGGIPQALLLMNGGMTAQATDLKQSRTLRAIVEAPFLDEAGKLDALYLATFTRLPSEEEREFLLEHVRSYSDEAEKKGAMAEIFWGLLNSPEFVLSR